ncbi:MAG TPA: OmpH family outer membrane protein [Bacteroidia bacterium]|nr:OmpH family outer membrane protein [Bacteroidia bacterium]HNU34251.1 OmpH family outer membrane protein [Bacteroidia bacterium]
MKNLSLIINGILAIAVGYLFVQVQSIKKGSTPATETEHVKTLPMPGGNLSVVFLNSDTLLEKYTYYQNIKKQIERNQKLAEAQIQNKADQLQKEIEAYQQKGAAMSEMERMKEEERLGRKQEEAVDFRKQLLEKLADEEEAYQDSLHNRLISFLKDYNKSHNYKFILGYQKGSGILLADDSLDITPEVIEGINKVK